jgi:hypothetical protein
MCAAENPGGTERRHVGHTDTHLITKVKQRWARLVLGGVTQREYAGCCWKVFPHLEAQVHVGCGIPDIKDFHSTHGHRYSKE